MTGSSGPYSSVVVTFREVERIFSNAEAVGHVPEAAQLSNGNNAAAAMAGLGVVLNELRRAESAAGAPVLTSPANGAAARLQSLIASGEAGNLTLKPLSTGGFEAAFDTN